ncbi:hypothetical protein AB0D24_43125 [Streptomyces javensis]|uniref:hypothetical protein n=1 Tax=Streptomyces javensis TaxID=114698 RepID=UPI0033C8E809
MADYNRYIEVAGNATITDEILAWAQTQDGNGRKDLQEVEKLVRPKKNLSATEIARANTLPSRHEGDPYFSEKFATDLGPKTLEFWQHVTTGQPFCDGRTKTWRSSRKRSAIPSPPTARATSIRTARTAVPVTSRVRPQPQGRPQGSLLARRIRDLRQLR